MKSTLVSIGGAKIGIIGLEEAFEGIEGKAFASDQALGDAIIDLIRNDNYIPASARDKYRKGLVRAYRAARGMPVAPAKVPERSGDQGCWRRLPAVPQTLQGGSCGSTGAKYGR